MSQLTNYIQKELGKGFSKDLITEKLIQAGYTKQEISESFKSLKSAEPLLRRKIADTIHEDTKVLRSKWLFPVLGIIVLIVLLYLVFQYIGMPSFPKTGCDALEGQERDICYLKLAAEGKADCSPLIGYSFKKACSEKLWDTEQCLYEQIIEEISDICKEKTPDCKDREDYSVCLTEHALASGDASLCQSRADCITALALETEDGSLCEQYLGDSKEICIDAYYEKTGDASYCILGDLWCGYTPDATDDEKKAFFEENLAVIGDILDSGERNEYLLEFAIENTEPLICPYLLSTGDNKNQELLNTFTITSIDFCIIAVAHEAQNTQICNSLTETHKNSLCLEMIDCNEGELCNEIQ